MTGLPVPATLDDAPTLADLHARSFAPVERWGAALFATQLSLPGVFGLLLADAGMVLARVAADEAEILTIAVVPQARGAGLGRALLRAAEARAVESGARAMYLEVAPGNLGAAALYASAGYVEVGRRRRYYPDGSDALLLARQLTSGAATGA